MVAQNPNTTKARSSVGMWRGMTDRQTDTQTAVTNIHFASATPRVKCNKNAHLILTLAKQLLLAVVVDTQISADTDEQSAVERRDRCRQIIHLGAVYQLELVAAV